jgi:hypothetical protein
MAGWVSACGQRTDGYGKILIERRVDERGHDISCWLGYARALTGSGR